MQKTIQSLFTPKTGVRIFAVWTIMLVAMALLNILVLTSSVELYNNRYGNQAIVQFILLLNIGFGTVFAVSAYGLWQQKRWSRLLFLWVIGIWAIINLVGLFMPLMARQHTTAEVVSGAIRYGVTLIVPLWYFNMPRVKALFYADPQENTSQGNK